MCIIPSLFLAVHQWGDLWGVLFLVFTCSISVGRSVGCIIPTFYLQYISWETVGCITPSSLLAVHQWGIFGVHYSWPFTCSTLFGRSVGCTIPSFLLAVHQWRDLWHALFLAF